MYGKTEAEAGEIAPLPPFVALQLRHLFHGA